MKGFTTKGASGGFVDLVGLQRWFSSLVSHSADVL